MYHFGGLYLLQEVVVETARVAGKAGAKLEVVLDAGVLVGLLGGEVHPLVLLLLGPDAVVVAVHVVSVPLEDDDVVVGDDFLLGDGGGSHC